MTAPTRYNGKPIPRGTWLEHAAETAVSSGLSPHDTVPVATYNRMVRKRDEALERAMKLEWRVANAPHEGWCPQYHKRAEVTCMCWKAGL